jgi:hypothetical protein
MGLGMDRRLIYAYLPAPNDKMGLAGSNMTNATLQARRAPGFAIP